MDSNTVAVLTSAIGVFGTVVVAYLSLRHASGIERERQIREDRSRDQDQARHVSGWIKSQGDFRSPMIFSLLNASEAPVYHVLVWVVLHQGSGPMTGEEAAATEMSPDPIDVVPPGRWMVTSQNMGDAVGMHMRAGVEVAFRDAAGLNWIRRVDGRLEKITSEPADHYHLDRPIGWGAVEPD